MPASTRLKSGKMLLDLLLCFKQKNLPAKLTVIPGEDKGDRLGAVASRKAPIHSYPLCILYHDCHSCANFRCRTNHDGLKASDRDPGSIVETSLGWHLTAREPAAKDPKAILTVTKLLIVRVILVK